MSVNCDVPSFPSVESYYGFTLGAEVRSRVAAYEEKTALQRKRQAKLYVLLSVFTHSTSMLCLDLPM